jgi:hypothetical protein
MGVDPTRASLALRKEANDMYAIQEIRRDESYGPGGGHVYAEWRNQSANYQSLATMVALGLSDEQIAARLAIRPEKVMGLRAYYGIPATFE